MIADQVLSFAPSDLGAGACFDILSRSGAMLGALLFIRSATGIAYPAQRPES